MNEDKLLTVARYLEGDMETGEKAAFEASLQADAELQELVARYKDVHQTLKVKIAPDEQDRQLENTLKELSQQYFKNEGAASETPAGNALANEAPLSETAVSQASVNEAPVSRAAASEAPIKEAKTAALKPYLKWLSVAAVLVIGLFVWAPWSSGLYEKYSFSKQMSVTERGADNQAQLSKAAELYNKGDYAEARKILGKEYMFNPQNPLLAYYFAITLIETGQSYEARTVLQHLFEGQSVFKYDAAFYAALSLLKEDKKAEAVQWLQKIPQENVNYAKAQELIAELKK
jgi:anti-sigma factor RsiW